MGASRSHALALAAAVSSACLTGPTQVRLAQQTPIAVAYVLDDVYRRNAGPVPAAVVAAVEAALVERNIEPRNVEASSYLPRFGALRDTGRRLNYLEGVAAGRQIILLVEAQARFYSQLSGRYRWNVYVKLTLRDGGSAAELTDEIDVPALLLFDHEREPEALVAAKREIAQRVGRLVDGFFAGKTGSEPTAAVTGKPLGSIYLVLVDRFFNGDHGNDGSTAPADPQGWHGGDIRGVIAKADYLHDLGIDTVWLTPIFVTQSEPFLGHGAFHGYWVEDLNRVEPRFGSEADLRALAAALHARGMRLVLDLVVNHVGYQAPLLTAHPDWFHSRRTIADWDDPVQLVEYEVHGLPDLAQEKAPVYEYLLAAARGWLERVDADGYRLDAVKHVPITFWSRFNRDLRATDADVLSIGELFDGAPGPVADAQARGGFSHMFDFPIAFALRSVFCGHDSPGALGAVLFGDRFYGAPSRMVTFLDNHDLPRIRSACGSDSERVRNALTAQFALRGVPALTYGTESGLAGKIDPDNRADMDFAPPGDRDLRDHVRRLLRLRREQPALRDGRTELLDYRDGLLVMGRIHPDQAAVLVVNAADNARRSVSLPEDLVTGARITDAFSDAPVTGQIEVGAGAVRLVLVQPTTPGAFVARLARPPQTRRVQLRVSGAELARGDSLRIVGTGPELGEWSPTAARPVDADLRLPVGGLFAFKLVVVGSGGEQRWESGDNRYLFVRAGTEPERLALEWRNG